MLKRVCCVDANTKQLAQMSNEILKNSKKFTEQAYNKGILSSRTPRFNQESVKSFYNIGDFYQKSGEISPDAKPVFAKLLNDFGLKADAKLADFKQYLLGVYK